MVTRRRTTRNPEGVFDLVKTVGRTWPDVKATTRYDGSPVLKLGGVFLAGMATDVSAEPDTMVVRYGLEERDWLIEDAPETYYLTDYYRRYPLILVRLARIAPDALRDVLSVSRLLTLKKVRPRRRSQPTAERACLPARGWGN